MRPLNVADEADLLSASKWTRAQAALLFLLFYRTEGKEGQPGRASI